MWNTHADHFFCRKMIYGVPHWKSMIFPAKNSIQNPPKWVGNSTRRLVHRLLGVAPFCRPSALVNCHWSIEKKGQHHRSKWLIFDLLNLLNLLSMKEDSCHFTEVAFKWMETKNQLLYGVKSRSKKHGILPLKTSGNDDSLKLFVQEFQPDHAGNGGWRQRAQACENLWKCWATVAVLDFTFHPFWCHFLSQSPLKFSGSLLGCREECCMWRSSTFCGSVERFFKRNHQQSWGKPAKPWSIV